MQIGAPARLSTPGGGAAAHGERSEAAPQVRSDRSDQIKLDFRLNFPQIPAPKCHLGTQFPAETDRFWAQIGSHARRPATYSSTVRRHVPQHRDGAKIHQKSLVFPANFRSNKTGTFHRESQYVCQNAHVSAADLAVAAREKIRRSAKR